MKETQENSTTEALYAVRIEAGGLVESYYVRATNQGDACVKASRTFDSGVPERTALVGEVTGCEKLADGERASWDKPRY